MTPIELIKNVGIFELFSSSDGCACYNCEIKGVKIWTHCWRRNCEKCKYSGIHVAIHWDENWDAQEIAEEVLKQIKEIWDTTTDFNIVIEEYK